MGYDRIVKDEKWIEMVRETIRNKKSEQTNILRFLRGLLFLSVIESRDLRISPRFCLSAQECGWYVPDPPVEARFVCGSKDSPSLKLLSLLVEGRSQHLIPCIRLLHRKVSTNVH